METSGVIDKISVKAYYTGYHGEGQEPKGVEADGAEMPRLALRDIIDKRAVLQEAVQGAIVHTIQCLACKERRVGWKRW